MVFASETIVFLTFPLRQAPGRNHDGNVLRCVRSELPAGASRLSSPDFLHNYLPLVKTTTGGKVGKSAKGVDSFYVNQK